MDTGSFINITRSTTAVDPLHLKDKEYISLTRNYCLTISIYIISLIFIILTHIFILKIQQILGSYELKGLCKS